MAKYSREDLRTYFNPTLINGNYAPEAFSASAYQKAIAAGFSSNQIQALAAQQSLTLAPDALSAATFGSSSAAANNSNSQVTSQINDLKSGFENQITTLNQRSADQSSALNARIAEQTQRFTQAQEAFGRQMAEQQAQFQQQSAQFTNLQNASVPTAERTAESDFTSGNSRSKTKRSALSSLEIVSGLGTQANPLSGLQLA